MKGEGRRMKRRRFDMSRLRWLLLCCLMALSGIVGTGAQSDSKRLLYVAVPGIRNYLEYGGVGVLVYDIDDGHRLLKRIPTPDSDPSRKPENVKGICAGAKTGRLYVSTLTKL